MGSFYDYIFVKHTKAPDGHFFIAKIFVSGPLAPDVPISSSHEDINSAYPRRYPLHISAKKLIL